MAEEGEEEDSEQSHVFECFHELAVSAVDGVVERLLDAVGAAYDCGEAGAEENRGRGH